MDESLRSNASFKSLDKIFVAIARAEAFVKGCSYRNLKKYEILERGVNLTAYPVKREGVRGIFKKNVYVITGIRVIKPAPNRTYCPFMNLFRDIIFSNFSSTEALHDEDVIFGTLNVRNWDFDFRRFTEWTSRSQRTVVEEHDAFIIMNRNELGDLQSEREHDIPLVFGDEDARRLGEHMNDFHERLEFARERLWRDNVFWQKVAYMFQSNKELNSYDPDLKYRVY